MNTPRWLGPLFASALLFFTSAASRGAVTVGALAIVGYDDAADSFTVLATESIAAGEVIYFTNNGWHSALGQFNGGAADQGAGNESLLMLTVSTGIAQGTLFSSQANGASWAWTRSGLVPGQQAMGDAQFSDLALDYESDQIYIFQASGLNPLLTPTSFIYALNFGSAGNPGFSPATDALTGDIPPALSLGAHTAFAHSNLTFHGDADGNHSAWGLDLTASPVAVLLSTGGGAAAWRGAIANSSNWAAGQPAVGMLGMTPEPTRAALLVAGLACGILRRRRLVGLRKCLKL